MCKKKGTLHGQLIKPITGVNDRISGSDNTTKGRLIVLDFVDKGETCLGEIDGDLISCLFPKAEYKEVLNHLKSGKPINIMGEKVGSALDPAYWEVGG